MSLYAIWIVASIRITTVDPRSTSATRDDGIFPWRASISPHFERRFQLVTRFRHAVAEGEVEVHYQPKVALATRAVVGVEALVRWEHPEIAYSNRRSSSL